MHRLFFYLVKTAAFVRSLSRLVSQGAMHCHLPAKNGCVCPAIETQKSLKTFGNLKLFCQLKRKKNQIHCLVSDLGSQVRRDDLQCVESVLQV